MDERRDLLSTREAARFDLVRRNVVNDDDAFQRAALHALRLSAEALRVERVGLWMFEREGTHIRCAAQWERGKGAIAAGEVIDLATCPAYAAALRTRRVLNAENARTDARTSELLPYFEQHDIGSLLDSPVFHQGDAIAIVCHEHVGSPRTWSTQDGHFAATISDMLSLYFEQRETHARTEELAETRKALEEHRVMESLGRMAAAVAHDFNNLLVAISLKVELLRMHKNSAAERERGMGEILGIVDQGSRLVRQLFDFARAEPERGEVTDLVEVARGLEPVLRTFERGGIRLLLQLPEHSAPVRIERSRAEQVLMNLATNARDALLGGGELTVAVQCTRAADGVESVELRVSDTGVGMDASVREHMFEPFYTTKPRGQGEGLGLGTVYRIVSASQGRIDVRSEPGAGTDFTVRWARASAASAAEPRDLT
jgi:two-component system cell cycle sensor histidine kinase/response regulator CckA